jgi:hypothetical protein
MLVGIVPQAFVDAAATRYAPESGEFHSPQEWISTKSDSRKSGERRDSESGDSEAARRSLHNSTSTSKSAGETD